MCGIAGIARIGDIRSAPTDLPVLRQMAKVLSLRGPDDMRFIAEENITFGFTRLAIVDLDSGHQPFISDDASIVLIVNGEIYNHRELAARLPPGTALRSGSDCEVLLHLYREHGLRFLDDVRGMFALALWDRRRGKLLLARDCFGIKPLFVHRNDERIAFASEIKALFEDPACPREIDWKRALSNRALSWEPLFFDDERPTTWWKGIDWVPAATIQEFDLRTGTVKEHPYWRLPDFGGPGDSGPSEEEFIQRYGELLAASVDDCMMSDVEIGILLSGGVDSASIAALATRRENIHAFTVLNGTTLVSGDAENAHLIAAGLGMPGHQVLFDADRVPGAEEWRRLLWLQETPVCGAEQFYKYELYRYVKATRPELKVMLLGQGSDEFNGGYSGEMADGGGWADFIANLEEMRRRSALADRPALAIWWDADLPLLSDEVLATVTWPKDAYAEFVRLKYHDIQHYNCWHEDRSASGSGVEARVPFLDRRLVELTATIPAKRRAALLWDKHIIRAATRGLLPESVRERPKVPFLLGPGADHTRRIFIRMLRQNGNELLEQALAGPNAKDVFDADGMRGTLHELRPDSSADLVLRLVNLGLLETLATSPPDLTTGSSVKTPQAHSVEEWRQSRSSLESTVLGRNPLTHASVIDFAENALHLRDEQEPTLSYLGVDNRIDYVINNDESPEWSRFLLTLDGRTNVEDTLKACGSTLAEVEEFIKESLSAGILVLADPEMEASNNEITASPDGVRP